MSGASTVVLWAFLALSLGMSNAASNSKDAPISKDPPSQGNTTSLEDMTSKELAEIEAITKECNETFRIEPGYIEALMDSGSFPDETDKTPKCFVRCYLEKMGLFSEEGVFDLSQVDDVFGGKRNGKIMDDVPEIAAKCAADRKETCKCERSYQFTKCLMEAEIKKYG